MQGSSEHSLPMDIKAPPPPPYSEVDPSLLQNLSREQAPQPTPPLPPRANSQPSYTQPLLSPSTSTTPSPTSPSPSPLLPPQGSPQMSSSGYQMLPGGSQRDSYRGHSQASDRPFAPSQMGPATTGDFDAWLKQDTFGASIEGDGSWAMNFLFFFLGMGIFTTMITLCISLLLAALVCGIPAIKPMIRYGYFAFPYGRRVFYPGKVGFKRILLQILWTPIAIMLMTPHVFLGIVWFFTIVGIPFAYQHFALARYFFFPFDAIIQSAPLRARDVYSPQYYFTQATEI